MPKFQFQSAQLKDAFTLARTVKPETGDYCLKFGSNELIIFAYDKRRYIRVNIPHSNVNSESDEFYLSTDKLSLFDSDLSNVTLTTNEKSLSVTIHDESQSRNANLKRKSIKSNRLPIPSLPDLGSAISVNANNLQDLLYQVSCSALVKNTKTEEEMKINQVHFYSLNHCAVSNARYHASVVYSDGLDLDCSIISSDIPQIRNFISRLIINDNALRSTRSAGLIPSQHLLVLDTNKRLYFIDPGTKSFLSVSKTESKKPSFSVLDTTLFKTTLLIESESLLKTLDWANVAIEGTQRMGFNVQQDKIELYNEKELLATIPSQLQSGSPFLIDLPVRYLHSIIKYIDGPILMLFNHEKAPWMSAFTSANSNNIKFVHYLASMRSR